MELRREGKQVDDLSQGNNPTARITEPKFRKFITNASECYNPYMRSILWTMTIPPKTFHCQHLTSSFLTLQLYIPSTRCPLTDNTEK